MAAGERVEMTAIVPPRIAVLIPGDWTQKKVCEIGERLTDGLRGERPLLVGLLLRVISGKLMRNVSLPCEIDFMDISSYACGASVSGVIRILKNLEKDIAGRHVLVVEDIVDTGPTLSYVRQLLLARRLASLEVCTLLSRPSWWSVEVDIKYLGFEIPDEFVVGYGLDYAGAYRNLPYICVLKKDPRLRRAPAQGGR